MTPLKNHSRYLPAHSPRQNIFVLTSNCARVYARVRVCGVRVCGVRVWCVRACMLQAFTPKVESTLNDGLNRTVEAVKDQVGYARITFHLIPIHYSLHTPSFSFSRLPAVKSRPKSWPTFESGGGFFLGEKDIQWNSREYHGS